MKVTSQFKSWVHDAPICIHLHKFLEQTHFSPSIYIIAVNKCNNCIPVLLLLNFPEKFFLTITGLNYKSGALSQRE